MLLRHSAQVHWNCNKTRNSSSDLLLWLRVNFYLKKSVCFCSNTLLKIVIVRDQYKNWNYYMLQHKVILGFGNIYIKFSWHVSERKGSYQPFGMLNIYNAPMTQTQPHHLIQTIMKYKYKLFEKACQLSAFNLRGYFKDVVLVQKPFE